MEISVIVPAYNAAPFLRDCLDNLLTQDFDDYEIIIVNDGSKDDTTSILSEIKDPKVRIIHQENSGAYRARRSGVLVAGGKYIAFCDADDLPRRDWLSVLHKKAAETGADITVCGYSRIEEKTGRVIAKEMCLSAVVETDEDKLPLLLLNTALWNKLFRASLLREACFGGCFIERPPRISEDTLFLAGLYPNVKRIAFTPELLYNYIVSGGGSLMSTVSSIDIENIQSAFCELRPFYSEPLSGSLVGFFSLLAFVSVAVILPLLFRGKSGPVVRNMYQFLDKEFPAWRRSLPLKYVLKSPFRIKFLKIYISVLCYRFHLFLSLVAVWQFAVDKLGISIKW